MRTIEERARIISFSPGMGSRWVYRQAQIELRALVEEIAAYCASSKDGPPCGCGYAIRRRFLGSPSAEEVVRKVWMDAESPAEIVSALRSAGLLREESP